MNLFKNINIGSLIKQRINESHIETERVCKFFRLSESEIDNMYKSKSLDTELLLKWSKLLEYDLFRIYTQHLILYAPSSNTVKVERKKGSQLPTFRKNIYTKEIIDFIIELLETGDKTKIQIIEEYNIPKTTLYKWIHKYKN